MNISEKQVEELYGFTRQHFVEWYDVQTELVDHLANDIEATWEENPTLTFEQARDASFKKFGVFGFMGVVDEKQKQMSKKYWRLVWAVFKDFFRIPQIIITATIFIAIYTFFTMFPPVWVFATIGLTGIVLMLIRGIKAKKRMRLRFEQTQKKWMLEEHIYGFGNFVGLFNIVFQIALFSDGISSNVLLLFMTFLLTIFSLVLYITAFVLPVKVEEILENEYPEYRSVTI